MGTVSRLHMEPAPMLPNRLSAPIDLGDDDDAEYAYLKGWKVVVDLDVDLKANELIASAQDETLPFRERNAAITEWVAKVIAEWNFVNNNTGEPLPQPREGGAVLCPQAIFGPLTRAAMKALQPKKA